MKFRETFDYSARFLCWFGRMRALLCICYLFMFALTLVSLVTAAPSPSPLPLVPPYIEQNWVENAQAFLRSLPRIGGDEYDPLSWDYWSGVLLATGVIATALCVPLVLALVYCVCGCLLSVCCSRNPLGYTSCERHWPLIFLLLLATLCALLLAPLFWYETQLNDSIKSVESEAIELLEQETQVAVYTLQLLADYNSQYPQSPVSVPAQLSSWSSFIQQRTPTQSAQSLIDFVVNVRFAGALLLLSVAALVVTLVCLASCGRCGRLAAFVCLFAIFSAALLAFLCCTNFFAAVFVADSCQAGTLNEYLINSTPSTYQPQVEYYLLCIGNGQQIWAPLPQDLDALDASLSAAIFAMKRNGTSPSIIAYAQAQLEFVDELLESVTQLSDCLPSYTAYSDSLNTTCNQLFVSVLSVSVFGAALILCLLFVVPLGLVAYRRWGYARLEINAKDALNKPKNSEEESPLVDLTYAEAPKYGGLTSNEQTTTVVIVKPAIVEPTQVYAPYAMNANSFGSAGVSALYPRLDETPSATANQWSSANSLSPSFEWPSEEPSAPNL